MKKRISRRTLLRGAGAAMALPWLEAMGSAAPATAGNLSEPPLRMMFFYMPNGVRPDHWTPPGDGEQYEITPHLKPLEGLKNDFRPSRKSVERQNRRPQRSLAQGSCLALGRLCGTHIGKRSRFRRNLG